MKWKRWSEQKRGKKRVQKNDGREKENRKENEEMGHERVGNGVKT